MTRTDEAREYLRSLSPRRQACEEIGVGYEWACKFLYDPGRRVASEFVDKILEHQAAHAKRKGRA